MVAIYKRLDHIYFAPRPSHLAPLALDQEAHELRADGGAPDPGDQALVRVLEDAVQLEEEARQEERRQEGRKGTGEEEVKELEVVEEELRHFRVCLCWSGGSSWCVEAARELADFLRAKSFDLLVDWRKTSRGAKR